MNFSETDIKMASKVASFMMSCRSIDEKRYYEATKSEIPHGDLAYGMALVDWYKKGKPNNAWFSYAIGQRECPLLMAFRQEISKEFGLEILTIEEGEDRRKKSEKVITKKVVDWGLN